MQPPAFDYRAHLVPGRNCGGCVACCIAPEIDAADFYKPVNTACRHCTSGNGCAIYDSRPQPCRAYHCVWRSMPTLDEGWRPDLSGVLIAWGEPQPGEDAAHAVKIVLLGDSAVLETDRFLALVGGFIARGVSTMFSVPRGAGHLNISLMLNAPLAPAIAARDRAGARALLRAIHIEMMKQPPVPDGPRE